MDAIQQHMLDTYRAAQLSEPAPPPPGRHDRAVLRDLYRHWLTHPPTRGPRDHSSPSAPPSPSGA
ncbi:hypothetical protein ABZ771_25415 [Streptomyces globisporus]|uniref:Uncharacterized protein n=1 Tax=Streptomyces globisporus TaxID=1908 RepID=A0ABM9H4H1_STRGL|nr:MULTISPECIES: hypothetical protein [Streptomyces]PPA41583.1 hypothetical protein BF14_018870 [Streptomyces griseus]RAN18907.1 hypothetical protein A3838_18410 [Streptomyces badius]RAN26809.1 hypothetical protein A3800_18420 [Streptomyces badius]RDL10481.1 hypothetical protein DER30_3979 [Streptomyces sp. HB202]WSQ93328.1 hypothetical protein OG425_19005 [Streptomyces globisporus]